VGARQAPGHLRLLFANWRGDFSKTINSIVVFVTSHFSKPQSVVVPPPKTDKSLTCHHKIAPHEGRFEKKNMSTAKNTIEVGFRPSKAARQVEEAARELLAQHARILERLSPEALACFTSLFGTARTRKEKRHD
jgi:hypothetical protein